MAVDGSVNGTSANGLDVSNPQSGTDLAIWLFFQIAADNVGLPILVTTFLLAKSVKRNPTLINMCITWIVAGVSSSILLYAGKESGAEPEHALCVLQASLMDAIPPMTSISALALIYTVWTSLNYMSVDKDSKAIKYGIYVLLIAPYVVFFSFALATSVVSIQDLSKVSRSRRFFYCSVDNNPLTNTMALFSALVCFICVVFEVLIAVRIIRTWRAFSNHSDENNRRGFDKQLILRLFIFSGYLIVALVFSAASIGSIDSPVPDIFSSTIGMAVFLVFGTQADVLRAWAFWLPTPPPPPPPKDPLTVNVHTSMYRFSQIEKPLAVDQGSIVSDTETLHDASHAHTMWHSRSATPSMSGHATPMTSSMMLRKGDSVLIIGKPEDAFATLGKEKHNSV